MALPTLNATLRSRRPASRHGMKKAASAVSKRRKSRPQNAGTRSSTRALKSLASGLKKKYAPITRKTYPPPKMRRRPAYTISRTRKKTWRAKTGGFVSQPFGKVPRTTTARLSSVIQAIHKVTLRPSPLTRALTRKIQGCLNTKADQATPFRPIVDTNGWPEEAIKDWNSWGQHNQDKFYKKWPELKSGNATPSRRPSP